MYKSPPSIEATPILADQTDVLNQQPTQNDVPRAFQDLKKAPVKLRYAKTDTPFFAPDYDFIGQILGGCMTKYGISDGDMILCQNFTNAHTLKENDTVIKKFVGKGIHKDWSCLRKVVSVDGKKVVLKSNNGIETLEDMNCPRTGIVAIATHRIKKPNRTPTPVSKN